MKLYKINCNLKKEDIEKRIKEFSDVVGTDPRIGYECFDEENELFHFLVWELQKDRFIDFLKTNSLSYTVEETPSWWDTASPEQLRIYNNIAKMSDEEYDKSLDDFWEMMGTPDEKTLERLEKIPRKPKGMPGEEWVRLRQEVA